MSSVALNNSSHAHRRGAFEQSSRNDGIRSGDGIAAAGDGEDAVVHALDDFADSGLDASLVTEIGDVLSTLSDDNASFLGRYDGTESELGLGVFLVCLRGGLAVRANSIINLQLVDGVGDVATVGGVKVLRGRHFGSGVGEAECCEGSWWWEAGAAVTLSVGRKSGGGYESRGGKSVKLDVYIQCQSTRYVIGCLAGLELEKDVATIERSVAVPFEMKARCHQVCEKAEQVRNRRDQRT